MDKKNRMATLVCGSVVLGVIGLTVCVGLWLPKSEEIIQGEVEVTDYRLSSKVPARVLEIRVEEGDRVRQGDTLVVLDAPDVDARLRQAEAAYHAAVAQERKAQNGTREEQVRSAYEQWQKARAGLDVAEKTWQRISRLAEQGVVAAQKRDEALAQRDAAAATEAAATIAADGQIASPIPARPGISTPMPARTGPAIPSSTFGERACRRGMGSVPRAGPLRRSHGP